MDGIASAETSGMRRLGLCWGEHTLLNVHRARTTKEDTLSGIGATCDVNWLRDCEKVDRNGAKELAIEDHMRILEVSCGPWTYQCMSQHRCPCCRHTYELFDDDSLHVVLLLHVCTPLTGLGAARSVIGKSRIALRHKTNPQPDCYLPRDR